MIFQNQQKPRWPETPARKIARARAYAMFMQVCNKRGWSKKAGRVWIADQMCIEVRYAGIYEMDEVECITVEEICTAALEPAPQKKKGRSRGAAQV